MQLFLQFLLQLNKQIFKQVLCHKVTNINISLISRYLGSDGKFSPDPRVIPFGVGRRRCLGELLARMSLYLFFTGILSRFDLKKARDGDHLTSKPMHGVTLTPHPYKIRFVTRK